MPNSQNRTVEEIYDDVCGRLKGVEHHGEYAKAFCPAHPNSDSQALSVQKRDDGVSFKCHAEDCATEEICKVLKIEPKDLFTDAPTGKVVQLQRKEDSSEAGAEQAPLGCTVEEYAKLKRLPADWLKSRFGLSDLKYYPKTEAPAMVIPYYDAQGELIRTRYRTALHKPEEGPDLRFHWRSGSKADHLYGLEDLPKFRKNGEAPILVEGESDRHTLIYHGFPALGVPGAQNLKAVRLEDFEGIETVYAVVETGEAGEIFGRKLGELFGDRLRLVQMKNTGFEDVSEMHLHPDDPDEEDFATAFEKMLEEAVSYAEQQQNEQNKSARNLWEECKDLALSENILAEFAVDFRKNGVVGLEREGKILYLASSSRILDLPVSVIVKGPSGAGKTYLVERVLDFMPEDAAKPITGMSDRAIAYSTESLKHRHLFFYEATAIQQSETLQTMLQTLLSEGKVLYDFVDTSSDGPPETKHIEKEGPSGAFITTTQQSLNHDNETRMLSLAVSDTQAQTRAVMKNIARRKRYKNSGPDLGRWQALQRWIELAGDKQVIVPYGEWLSDQIPPVAVRLRRDFEQVLNLIEAHAILHQANRARTEWGEIVATRQDYAVVRGLLYELLSEQLEAAVPPIVRETVEALTELYENLEAKSDGISGAKLSAELNIDKAATSRRIQSAIRRGFIKNLEAGKRGVKARYIPDDDLPEDVVVLPEADEIPEECCAVDRADTKEISTPNTHEEDREEAIEWVLS